MLPSVSMSLTISYCKFVYREQVEVERLQEIRSMTSCSSTESRLQLKGWAECSVLQAYYRKGLILLVEFLQQFEKKNCLQQVASSSVSFVDRFCLNTLCTHVVRVGSNHQSVMYINDCIIIFHRHFSLSLSLYLYESPIKSRFEESQMV